MNAQKPIANDYISDACVGQGGCWQYGSTSAAVFGSAGRFSKSQPPQRVAFSAPSSLSQRATGSLLHTGKEKDPLRLYLQSGELCRARLTSPPDLLTGYSYFGARHLDHELMTGWHSVDPMADKYPSLSPYAYCAWNPVRLVDPEECDTIFPLACHTEDQDYNLRNSNILKALRNIGDGPFIQIAMHGSKIESSVEVSSTVSGSQTRTVKAKEIAQKIESGSFGSFLYGSNIKKNKLTIIILYSCYTGRGENSFGQQLSELLESAIVIAPVGAVWAGINENGKTTIENREVLPLGNTFLKKGPKRPWRIFYNGQNVESFTSAPQSWIFWQGGVDMVSNRIKKQYGENN